MQTPKATNPHPSGKRLCEMLLVERIPPPFHKISDMTIPFEDQLILVLHGRSVWPPRSYRQKRDVNPEATLQMVCQMPELGVSEL